MADNVFKMADRKGKELQIKLPFVLTCMHLNNQGTPNDGFDHSDYTFGVEVPKMLFSKPQLSTYEFVCCKYYFL